MRLLLPSPSTKTIMFLLGTLLAVAANLSGTVELFILARMRLVAMPLMRHTNLMMRK